MSDNYNIIKNDENAIYDEKIHENIYFKKEVNYSEIYKKQLIEMEKMGFYDKNRNIRMLILANGNLNDAVSFLFD